MAVKTTLVLLLLGMAGILEVQAASIANENDMWKNLDEGLPYSLLFETELIEITGFFKVFSYLALNLEGPGARFSKDSETFRAPKSILNSSLCKN